MKSERCFVRTAHRNCGSELYRMSIKLSAEFENFMYETSVFASETCHCGGRVEIQTERLREAIGKGAALIAVEIPEC